MRIEELHLKNFRCFKELDIQFPKSNLAVFIGLNGSGKTTILDAISLGFANSFSAIICEKLYASDKNRKNKPFTVGISENDIKNNLDSISKDFSETFTEITIRNKENFISWESKYSKDNPNSLHISIKKESEKINSFICISYDALKEKIHTIDGTGLSRIFTFEWFEDWFEEEENIENELILDKKDFSFTNLKLDVTRKAMSIFLGYLSGANFHSLKVKRTYNATEKMGTYEEEINKHDSFLVIKKKDKELKISQLSAGERLLLHIVGDISYKLVIANNGVEENDVYCDTILASSGIVLIDEIELHLHPQWQREVLPALQKTFPNIQFIVTTHSPQVLSNLKKEEVFILKDSKVSEFKPYIEGRDSNSILSEVFGVSERPKIFQEKLNEFYKAIDNKNLDDAKKLLKNLEEYWGTSDIEILKADLHLSFAEE